MMIYEIKIVYSNLYHVNTKQKLKRRTKNAIWVNIYHCETKGHLVMIDGEPAKKTTTFKEAVLFLESQNYTV